jgi:hypothetical protein
MFQRTSMPRAYFPKTFRRSRLELMELESRDQPALFNLTTPIISIELFSPTSRAAATFSSNLNTDNAAISVRETGTPAPTLDISITEIVGPIFTSLIITVAPEASSTPATSTMASVVGNAGNTATPLSVQAAGAATTPFAPVQAEGTTATGVGTDLHGTTTAPTTTTPFIVIPESPAVRGGGPTSDAVAPRVAGSTTGVLGPPTATNLSAGGLGGVYELVGPQATAARTTIAPRPGDRTRAEVAPPTTPSLAKPGATAGGEQAQQNDDAGAAAKLAAAKPWLQRYGRSAALTTLAAAAGGYGVIRWRRSRALKRASA